MIYSILVLSSPGSGQISNTAVQFAKAVITRGHSIHRIFFIDAGTEAASITRVVPQDVADYTADWTALSETHAVDLVICITSALSHGMLDETEASRYGRPCATVNSAFTVSGLGQLVDACACSDRLITFGG